MNEETTVDESARSLSLLRIGTLIAAAGFIDHFLPLDPALGNWIAAIAIITIPGLGLLSMLPRAPISLAASIVLGGGLSVATLASTTLLFANLYTPDRAALMAGAVGIVLLALVRWKRRSR